MVCMIWILLPYLPADEGNPKLKPPVFFTNSSDTGYRKINVKLDNTLNTFKLKNIAF